MTTVDDDINLEQLKLLKKIFEEADEDGSGELDIDEFCTKLGPHLGANLSREQVAQLFMKIDADAGGTVDWEEFTNYMFLERAQNSGESASENWRLFPQDFRDKNDPSVYHRGPVDKLVYCDAIDKYITCSRDGSFRLWNANDLKHFRTVTMGSSWITDCLYMPQARKLVFTTVDRAISYYEANRGSYDLSGRVYASGMMGVPQCLGLVPSENGEQLVYGDSKGKITMLLCGTREWPARDLISTDEHQDYLYIHQNPSDCHNDWVTQVTWVPEIGLVSSSLDATVKVYDFVREKVINTCTHHNKGVHGFVWCRAYSMFASCGLERDVLLWQGNTLRRVGELVGHTASVAHIALDEKLNHVFTLSVDKMVKVWDLRNHKCLQTISQDDWARPEESRPHSLIYDATHRRIVTAVTKPYVWVHKLVAQDRTGHMDPVKGALFNSIFSVIVSADECGTVCVWNALNGTREGRFKGAQGDSKLTAMTFDRNERRLLTAGFDGSIKMWNFNNGSLLREYKHDDEPLEISTVIFAADEKRGADAVYGSGWNCRVFVWEDNEDDDSEVVSEYKTFEGHREDIMHMVAFPDRQLLATGDYEGRINILNLFTGEKRLWLCHRAERYETSVDRLVWLPAKKDGLPPSNPTVPLLLLSAGGDGLIRVWLIGAVGKLMCTLPGAQGRLEQVSSMCTDTNFDHVVIGDAAGHIRVYDISAGIDVTSSEGCRASFKQRAHWRGHEMSINSVAPIRNQPVIVVGSKDCNVSMWDLDGSLVGIMGEDSWDLADRGTWRDLEAASKRPVLHEEEDMYIGDQLPSTVLGVAGKAEEAAPEVSCIQMANMMLLEKKARQREAANARPPQLHSMLRVHELQEVPFNVAELLHKEHRKSGTHKPAAKNAPSAMKGGRQA